MDPLQIHFLVDHVPMVGAIAAVLLLSWGLVGRRIGITVAALGVIVLMAVITIPMFVTRMRIGVEVAQLPGVSTELLQKQNEAAVAGLIGVLAAAAVALTSLFVWKTTRRYPLFSATAALVIALAAVVLVVRGATLGAEIRQPHITPSAASTSAR